MEVKELFSDLKKKIEKGQLSNKGEKNSHDDSNGLKEEQKNPLNAFNPADEIEINIDWNFPWVESFKIIF